MKMHKSRQSRRSACDRCRNYKLRCERLPPERNACERCIKIGVVCTTTTRPSSWSPRRSSGSSRGSIDRLNNARASESAHVNSVNSDEGELNHSTGSSGNIDMEFNDLVEDSLVGFSFDHFDMQNDGFGSLGLGSEGTIDPTRPCSPSTGWSDLGDSTTVQDTPSSILAPKAPSNFLKSALELSAELIDDLDHLRRNDLSPSRIDKVDTIGEVTQRALSRTSRLTEIINEMTVKETSTDQYHTHKCQRTHSNSSLSPNSNDCTDYRCHARPQPRVEPSEHRNGAEGLCSLNCGMTSKPAITQERHSADILSMTTIVSAYVLLLRTWRAIFSKLHRILTSRTPPGPNLSLALPSLQLGGFYVQGKFHIQLAVLLELSSSMLQGIEMRLAIGNETSRINSEQATQPNTPIVSMSPIAVSIRDTLLSQEAVRVAAEDSFGNLSLKDLMSELRKEVNRRE